MYLLDIIFIESKWCEHIWTEAISIHLENLITSKIELSTAEVNQRDEMWENSNQDCLQYSSLFLIIQRVIYLMVILKSFHIRDQTIGAA